MSEDEGDIIVNISKKKRRILQEKASEEVNAVKKGENGKATTLAKVKAVSDVTEETMVKKKTSAKTEQSNPSVDPKEAQKKKTGNGKHIKSEEDDENVAIKIKKHTSIQEDDDDEEGIIKLKKNANNNSSNNTPLVSRRKRSTVQPNKIETPVKQEKKGKTIQKKRKRDEESDSDEDSNNNDATINSEDDEGDEKSENEDDDEDDDDDDEDDDDYDDEVKIVKTSSKKTPKKKAKIAEPAKKKQKVTKKEKDEDVEIEEVKRTNKKKTSATVKKETKSTPKKDNSSKNDKSTKKGNKTKIESTGEGEDKKETKKKGKKKEKEEEEEVEIYQWWREESIDEIENKKYSKKWKTFTHNGVMFPPDYVPHGIPVIYDGKKVTLESEEEEIATMFAVMKDSDYYGKETFRKNFWKSWSEILGDDHVIQCLDKCDFSLIYDHCIMEKEKKKSKTKEEKKAEKEEREKIEAPYQYAYIDGRKEKVANFKVEPPGLFRGRGEHPKMGCLKKRVQPEDVTINIGKKSDAPKPPKGHSWKEVVTNHEVTWLAMWKDNIKGDFKYVNLAASSSFKGRSDYLKYETARKLKDSIDKIRENYKKDWKSKDSTSRQRGVALYFIDKLALRVGNEKDSDEADTVGCCSLRIEHIELEEPNIVKFDFLGKDSIRYQNSVNVELEVFKILKKLVNGKKETEKLFDGLTTTSLNSHLKSQMDKLTAKVFRTFNASLTLDDELKRDEESLKDCTVTEKLAYYNAANKQVAILCNHQRAAPKTFDEQIQRVEEKIEDLKEYLEELKTARRDLKKKDYESIKESWDKKYEKLLKNYEKEFEEYEEERRKVEEEAKGRPASVIKQLLKDIKVPKKPAKRALPKNDESLKKQIEKVEARIKEQNTQKQMKIDNKTVALGTSRINYCDPRITIAWCKRNNVPVNKIFNKSLMSKFPWAMDVEEEFEF